MEVDLAFLAACESDGFLEFDVANPTVKRACYRRFGVIFQNDARLHRRQRVAAVNRHPTAHERVAQRHIVGGRSQINIVPNADVAASNRRNPVPSDRRVEGRIVGTENAAVEVGRLLVFQFCTARIRAFLNLHRQHVHAVVQIARHVGFSAQESPLDAVDFPSVQPNICLPIDAVEIQENALSAHLLRHSELASIPEIAVEKRLADREQIVVVVGIRQRAGVHIRHQNRRRHRRHRPRRGIKALFRDIFTRCRHLRSALQTPVAAVEEELKLLPLSLSKKRGGIFLGIPTDFLVRFRDKATAPHHFDFRQNDALRFFIFGDKYADEAGG